MASGSTELAASFRHATVAAAYRNRPPYPDELFDILDRLVADGPRLVLDLGAGDGALARPMAERVERVDAVEISRAMVDADPVGTGSTCGGWSRSLSSYLRLGPYALVTAGVSGGWR